MIPNRNKIIKRLIIERDALRSSSLSDPHKLYNNSKHKSTITSKTPIDRIGPKPLNHAHTNVTFRAYKA